MRNLNTNWKIRSFLLDALCSEVGDWDQNSTHVNGSCHLLKNYNDWMIYKSLLVSTPCFWCQESKKKYEVILWNVCTVHNFEQMAFPFLRNYVIPKFDMVGIILIIWYYHFILLSMTFNWMNIIACSTDYWNYFDKNSNSFKIIP